MAFMKRAFLSVLLLTIVFVATAPAGAQIEGDFPEVVVFATSSMSVESSAQVFSGDVVVNNAPVGTLTFGNKAKTPAGYEVKANSIVAGNNVTLAGTEFCNVGNVSCEPGGLSLPVYTKLPIFQAASAGANDVNIPNGDTVVLTPGAYGDISGGVESSVIFEPGVYDVASITIDRKGDLLFQGDTEVRVAGAVDLGVEVDMRADAGYTVAARQVVFYVAGDATLGSKSTTSANVYSLGSLELPGNIIATGAFLGTDVVVGSKAKVYLDSHFLNRPPVAGSDAATITEDDPATTISVLANDSDPDGDSIAINSVTQPANGTVVITNGGADLTYEPDPDYCNDGSPTDDFTYEVCDDSTAINGNGCTAGVAVSVSVTCVNDPPVANDDDYDATEDTVLNVAAPGVLGNDTDVEGDALSAVLDSDVANGTLGLNADGSFSYTPNANYCGPDGFTYHANDGADDSNIASVSIDVECVNDAPVAEDDSYSATEDTQLVIAAPGVLANDSDVEGPVSVGSSDSASANGGVVSVAADGSFTYDPAADFCGSDSFGYTATDGDLSDSATVTIDVACVNDAPVANDDTASTDQDTAVVIPVLANDSDPDNDPLTVSLPLANTSSGSVTTDGTTVTYTPVQNFFGEDRFDYDVCDDGSPQLCDSAEVVVAVADVPQAPTADPQDVIGVTGVVSITLTGTDPDGDALTFDVVTAPRGILTGLPATDGTPAGDTSRSVMVTYDPDGDTSEDSFVFSVDDGTFTAQATVRINPGQADPGNEDPPEIETVEALDQLCESNVDPISCNLETLVDEGISITLEGDAPCDPTGAADPDLPCDGTGNDVPLSFSNLTGSAGATFANLTQGTGNPQRTAIVEYTPPPGFTGVDSFTFDVTGDLDGAGGDPPVTATATVEIAVNARATLPPVVAEDQMVSTEPETPVVIDLGASSSGGGIGGPHEFAGFAASAAGSSSGDANGLAARRSGSGLGAGTATLVPISFGAGWEASTNSPPAFFWSGYDGQTPQPATQGPFEFTGAACVSVTDDFQRGDQFLVKNNGAPMAHLPSSGTVTGETSFVPRAGGTNDGVGPDAAFIDTGYSSQVFEAFGNGPHSISIEIIGNSFSGGRGYIRVDPIGSAWCNGVGSLTYTIETLPQGGSLSYEAVGPSQQVEAIPITSVPFTLPQIGGVNLNAVTYTPDPGTTGGTSQAPADQFTYSVSNGLTSDSALVGFVIEAIAILDCEDAESACDDGRGGGGGGFAAGSGDGPGGGLRDGAQLSVSVVGPGDVSSSRPVVDGESYRGLLCTGGTSCGANFVEGSTVVLYARPTEASSEFVEWGGDCYGSAPVALVRAGGGTHCTATFRERKE